MGDNIQEKIAEVVAKIQKDPDLLKDFTKDPSKTIEKVAGINIPDFLEPKINQMAKEGIQNNSDPMEIVKKFIK